MVHWYVGTPPLSGFAVNTIGVPGHTGGEGLADIVTDGVTTGFTVMVIAFDVAEAGDAQIPYAVSIQVTTFPFDRDG
jgi:hypothetical protein